MKKLYSVPIIAILIFLIGCSNGQEAEQELNQAADELEQSAEEAAQTAKEKTEEAAEDVKENAPDTIAKIKGALEEGKETVKQEMVEKGDTVKAEEDFYLAATPEAYDSLYDFIQINDYDGIKQLEEEKDALLVEKGTELEVLDRDPVRVKVAVKAGDEEGFAPVNLLEPAGNS
ncbi:YtxH domain-containing protein [Bacillus infantis]|uniref:Lipoprotein n=1 Tax=Bacillus infantis TaxID=324767 RepID=A0A5D4QZ36_9BACI|nr:YtxH domain-containing protein [Bacillus infantis]TYS43171.1 hypothetical protein FZD51_22060 [Bacillus infantis]